MPISPYDGEQLIADEIRRIYAEAELRTIEAIASRLKKGNPDAQQWANEKLKELRFLKGEINEDVIEYLKNVNPDIEDAIEEAYKMGQRVAEADLKDARLDVNVNIKGTFGSINQKAVEALAAETVNKLNSTHFRILRQADDAYRQAVAEASSGVITGTETRRQAAQRVMDKLANRGITGFKDEAGRYWKLDTYAEMATRSATGRAALEGYASRLQENGRDLVIVSDHGEECELCRPWERRILSLSGKSKKYPSLAEAQKAGLFHPNCRHTYNLYVRGLTRDVGQKNAHDDPEGYKIRQQQRYNERQIRKWKRRKAAALDEKAERKANTKIREWQARQRELVDKHGLRRKYEREQVNSSKSFEKFHGVEYNKRVKDAYEKALKNEPNITKDLQEIADNTGTELVGLKHRIKTKDSYLRKIKSDSIALTQEAVSEAAKNTNDIIRYTYQDNVQELVNSYQKIVKELKVKGYEGLKVKNTWLSKSNPYRGVNTVYRNKNGQTFEVQFHTPESFELKNGEMHKLYEEFRKDDTSAERRTELTKRMFDLSSKLTEPKDIEKI